MTDAPERIWVWEKLFENGGRVWTSGESVNRDGAWAGNEYIRADLPPTLAAALAVPEVNALVTWAEAICVFYCDDNSTYMQSLRSVLSALRAASEKE